MKLVAKHSYNFIWIKLQWMEIKVVDVYLLHENRFADVTFFFTRISQIHNFFNKNNINVM